MANALTYQSEFTGPQMDERFAAVAQLQAALTEVETALSAKYVKPASGIPETDMDAAVQNALAKARSAVQDLSNYYTKTEIDALLSAVNSQEYVDVASLPTASASTLGKIYLVGPDSNNQYDRYYTSYDGSDYSWVAAGSTEINLSNYATKAELNQLDQKVTQLEADVTGVQKTANAEVYQVNPSDYTDTPNGTRLRLLFQIKKGDRVSAETTEGKGLSVDIYATKVAALTNGNSDNLQAFTNRQYAASASGTAYYDGVLVVSLCKNDSTAFSAQDKADFIAATTIVVTGKSLDDKIGSVEQRMLNGKFDVSAQLTTHTISGLVPGHRYRLLFKNPGWDISGVPSNTYLFRILSYYNSVGTDLISVTEATKRVANYYDFIVPDNSDEIHLQGEGANGTTIEFSLVDITDILSNGFVWDSQEDAMFALRVPTSSYAAIDNSSGTRLRVIYYVPQGTKFKVLTTETSGLHAGLSSTLAAAVYASSDIEQYTSGYQSGAEGQTSADGFLTFSLTNENTAISDERKAEMLSSLNVFVGYGQARSIYELQQGNNGNSVSALNGDMEDALVSVGGVNSYKSGGYQSPVGEKKNLSILAITDVHGTFDAISRSVEFANGKTDFIDYVACLGDIVLRSPADSITDFEDSFANCVKPFLFTVGNHDIADTGLAAITEAQARTKYFTQIVSKGWISNFKDANSCSWYKDDSTHKIRMISVFEYGNSQEIASDAPNTYCRRWIPTDTLQWFADTLYSTPSDYSVVVLLHQIPFFPATYVEGKFTISSDMRISLSQFFLNTVDGNPFGDIVNAFINGANFSQTYNSILSYELGKTATVAKDFSIRGEGNFICYVVGHFHGSYIFKDTTYPSQITVAVPSGSRSSFQQQYGDTNYAPDTRNQDQFYIIGFDTEKELINIAKIGGQVTNDMVKRDIISVKY